MAWSSEGLSATRDAPSGRIYHHITRPSLTGCCSVLDYRGGRKEAQRRFGSRRVSAVRRMRCSHWRVRRRIIVSDSNKVVWFHPENPPLPVFFSLSLANPGRKCLHITDTPLDCSSGPTDGLKKRALRCGKGVGQLQVRAIQTSPDSLFLPSLWVSPQVSAHNQAQKTTQPLQVFYLLTISAASISNQVWNNYRNNEHRPGLTVSQPPFSCREKCQCRNIHLCLPFICNLFPKMWLFSQEVRKNTWDYFPCSHCRLICIATVFLQCHFLTCFQCSDASF